MNERPNPDDESSLDPAHGSDLEPTPSLPKNKPKVTPLDEDKNIEHGIEVKET